MRERSSAAEARRYLAEGRRIAKGCGATAFVARSEALAESLKGEAP